MGKKDVTLNKNTEVYGSRFGALMSMVGMCVGLGNVWRFPYLCGQDGGGAFVVAYLICLAIVVIPLAIVEAGYGKGNRGGIMLRSNQKIGVLTANAVAINDGLLKSCGIEHPDRLVIADLRNGPHFSAIMEDRGEFDNNEVRKEVLAAASELTKANDDIGAILLECSDMPPYASAIQREVGLPVFDFITMIKWLHSSVSQTPYSGWI